MFLTFLLVLIGIELMKALRGPGWPRWVATALVVLIVARIVPHSLADMRDTAPRSELTDNLQSDLEKLGGTAGLQGQVQCLDLVYGCLNALYRERLVENTGFTGDLLVFDDKDGPAVEYHRAKWWKLQQEHPASVLVLTDEYFQYPDSFDRVKNWPAYGALHRGELHRGSRATVSGRVWGESAGGEREDAARIQDLRKERDSGDGAGAGKVLVDGLHAAAHEVHEEVVAEAFRGW